MSDVRVRVGRSTDDSAGLERALVMEFRAGRAEEGPLSGEETARLAPEYAGDSGVDDEPGWACSGQSCRPSSLAHRGVVGSGS